VELYSSMPDYEGDEGLDGLDDALGIVVARKTNEQKRVIDQHDEKIVLLDEEVERLKKRTEAQIDQELYTRDYTALRRDATEAAILAREARHDVVMHSATVRDELTQQLREELAKGLTAQNALATSHAQALAGLQTSSLEHNGRLSAAEAALRSATEAQATFSGDLQERIASGLGASGAQIEQAQQDISSAKGHLDRLSEAVAALKADNEQLRGELD
jgi:chromosome segregation ATPase